MLVGGAAHAQPVNTPPTALARNVTIDARTICPAMLTVTPQEVDNGSSDQQDLPNLLTFELLFRDDPDGAGPLVENGPIPANFEYPEGDTRVRLKVTDTGGLMSIDNARVRVRGDDCNGNRVPDTCDISRGTSLDCDEDGIPDECECLWDNGSSPATANEANGQLSHYYGGTNRGNKAADDFILCEGFIHKINGFRGQMLSNSVFLDTSLSTPQVRGQFRARLEFYHDCNGHPEDEPFAVFTNSVVEREAPAPDDFKLVTYFFDLCDENLWLEGGKVYWVSLIGLNNGKTIPNTQTPDPNDLRPYPDLSFWAATTNSNADPDNVLARGPKKADGLTVPTIPGELPTWGPWMAIDDCCIGCVNFAFKLNGKSCPLIWDNGGPALSPPNLGGRPSGAFGAATEFRTADDFIVKPCGPNRMVCFIEAYVWATCTPVGVNDQGVTPDSFIEIYEEEPCRVVGQTFPPFPGGPIPVTQRVGPKLTPLFAAPPTQVITPLDAAGAPIVRMIEGVTYTLYCLRLTDPPWTLMPGRTYWLSAGCSCGTSFQPRVLFAFNDDCARPGCLIKIQPSFTRRLNPSPLSWSKNTRDTAFRIALDEVPPLRSLPAGDPGTGTIVCRPDSDLSGEVDADDVFYFLDLWFEGCP